MLPPDLNKPFTLENIFSSTNSWKHFAASEIINKERSGLSQQLDGLKNGEGTYVFWWTGSLDALNELNRKILLQGKKENGKYKWHAIEMQTSWLVPMEIEGQVRFALYVGKSTTLRNRIRQHFHFSHCHDEWKEKMFEKNDDNHIGYNMLYKPTTSCQFRSGMTLLCSEKSNDQLWKIIEENVSLSILEIKYEGNSIGTATRFYLEDYLIGALRSWFNLDSER